MLSSRDCMSNFTLWRTAPHRCVYHACLTISNVASFGLSNVAAAIYEHIMVVILPQVELMNNAMMTVLAVIFTD